jgi:hypothetical protein
MSTREEMIKVLGELFPITGTTEDFNGSEGGIWICAECGYLNAVGVPFFDYYARERIYDFGVLSNLKRLAERHGWYFEWYDAGTIMAYPG